MWLGIVCLCLCVTLLLFHFLLTHPERVSALGNANPWEDVSLFVLNGLPGERIIKPLQFRSLRLDRAVMADLLKTAPLERTPEGEAKPLLLPFPLPNGKTIALRVVESPIMEPELAAKFPEIKTYAATSAEDPTLTARLDLTPHGFHAMVLSASVTVYLDPLIKGNANYYAGYYKTDFRKDESAWSCEVLRKPNPTTATPKPLTMNGAALRTFRLACAATGEYTAFHGGTVNAGMAAITTSINRVNAVYERDLAVRMNLVANNNLIVYTNPTGDPYTNNNGLSMLSQNQTTLDSVIGDANYDIGHVFSTGGGGVAQLFALCQFFFKARGVTGSSAPIGDPFNIDYVAHEIGHQFGADHSFNGSTSNCGSGNRNPATAYEPGSGSTIMAYAGICGAENLQPNSDDHFHVVSLEEITTFLSGTACGVTTNTGNHIPTVSAGASYTIPQQTPFTLTATGSDGNGDTLTYCWEQYDLGNPSPPNTDDGARPIFRSFSPTTNPARTFPRLSDILNNTTTLGEALPTSTRTLTFQVTARDNRAGGGAFRTATVNLQSTASAGPFMVLSPNTLINWPANSPQVVSWDIANTNLPPVNCANVMITLSTDGGLTYPHVLAASTPNTGTANVTAPNLVTTQARVKVQAVGNIFFDVSNTNFNIGAPCQTITLNPATLPGGTVGTAYSQNLSAMGGTGAHSFAVTSGALPTSLSLAGNGALMGTPSASGTFTFTVTATEAGGCQGAQNYSITIAGGGTLTANPNPIQLCNGATTGVTTLSWTAPAGVTTTRLHVGSPTGALFSSGGATGSATTGNWASNGMQFFLVSAVNNTVLATATITTTTVTCQLGTLTANPNPIPVCDGTGLGVTTLTWNAPNVTTAQVRVGSPTGTLFAQGGAMGSATTGKWVSNGLQFFLINAANGATLATYTATVNSTNCPSGGTLTLNPNPIPVCDGSGLGTATVNWNAPGITATRVTVGSPTGVLFTSGGATGSATTGKWVREGLTFYLINAANNAVLAIATASLATSGCSNGVLTANPNPIMVCNGSGLGVTTLSWNAPSSVSATQVRVGSPTGTLFSGGGATGSATTGLWVINGLQFFLQDVSGGLPGVTLGSVTVTHTTVGCRSSGLAANR
jgi:hypothetical protein